MAKENVVHVTPITENLSVVVGITPGIVNAHENRDHHIMSNQTENRIQGRRELTTQELEAISGGWAGYVAFIFAFVRTRRDKTVMIDDRDDDCGPCNGSESD